MRNFSTEFKILDAKGADGIGSPMLVEDWKTITLKLGSASNANLVVKFQGSIADTMPNFAGAQTVANHWDYVDVIDLEDGASVDGDTGITLGGTDDFRVFEVNASGLKWICAIVSSWSVGSVTLTAKGFNE
jgi:hypothetical protein